MVLGDSLLIIN
jgi:predicted nuclease with TOPRIM domain